MCKFYVSSFRIFYFNRKNLMFMKWVFLKSRLGNWVFRVYIIKTFAFKKSKEKGDVILGILVVKCAGV